MRVLRLTNGAASPALVSETAAEPHPSKQELLVRVCAAGIIPTELGWYPTWHTKSGANRSGAIPAHEFCGVVAAIGEEVGGLELGREVFGMNDWFSDGALAEYCVAPFSSVAPRPSTLTHAEAASVPISALTAWQGLLDRAKLQPGERVLIHGGAGGVGCFAVQLAHMNGCHAIATASAANAAFVRELGAEQVIDYRSSPFEQQTSGVDVVFDTVGGDVLERSWSVLRSGGRLVTVVSSAEQSTDPRVKAAFFIVEPNHKQLSIIGGMLDSRKLRAVVDTTITLTRAAEAYAGRAPGIHRGKVVVTIAGEN